MTLPVDHIALYLPLLVFVIAALYAMVGHGGASGYIAIMSLAVFSPSQISTTALLLNVMVAGIAFINFARAGYFSWRLTWPFLLTSVPAVFVGSLLNVSDRVYFMLVAFALTAAAFRLLLPGLVKSSDETKPVSLTTALSTGAGVGLLSGIVGVGGGIFLSPLMILSRWADIKTTSATAACFVAVNSVVGLLGRWSAHTLDLTGIGILPVAAVAGGLIGARLGAFRFNHSVLRPVLAIVLAAAAFKLIAA